MYKIYRYKKKRYVTEEEQKYNRQALSNGAVYLGINIDMCNKKSPCSGCMNNPANGGSGVCNCALNSFGRY